MYKCLWDLYIPPQQKKGVRSPMLIPSQRHWKLVSAPSDTTSVVLVRATDTVLPLHSQLLQPQMNKKGQQSWSRVLIHLRSDASSGVPVMSTQSVASYTVHGLKTPKLRGSSGAETRKRLIQRARGAFILFSITYLQCGKVTKYSSAVVKYNSEVLVVHVCILCHPTTFQG